MAAEHPHLVVLTGAGISAESGLSTFRDNGGLWEQYSVYDVATLEAFARVIRQTASEGLATWWAGKVP